MTTRDGEYIEYNNTTKSEQAAELDLTSQITGHLNSESVMSYTSNYVSSISRSDYWQPSTLEVIPYKGYDVCTCLHK